jgi:hypothetical protein
MSNFKVGEKVVCIGTFSNLFNKEDKENEPKINEIVTISGIKGNGFLYLKEYPKSFGLFNQSFNPSKFRKLDHQFSEDVIAKIIKQVQSESLTLSN